MGQGRVRGRTRGQVDTSAVGASRGKRGAEGGRAWGGGVPLPNGGGVWGAAPLPPPGSAHDLKAKLAVSNTCRDQKGTSSAAVTATIRFRFDAIRIPFEFTTNLSAEQRRGLG